MRKSLSSGDSDKQYANRRNGQRRLSGLEGAEWAAKFLLLAFFKRLLSASAGTKTRGAGLQGREAEVGAVQGKEGIGSARWAGRAGWAQTSSAHPQTQWRQKQRSPRTHCFPGPHPQSLTWLVLAKGPPFSLVQATFLIHRCKIPSVASHSTGSGAATQASSGSSLLKEHPGEGARRRSGAIPWPCQANFFQSKSCRHLSVDSSKLSERKLSQLLAGPAGSRTHLHRTPLTIS